MLRGPIHEEDPIMRRSARVLAVAAAVLLAGSASGPPVAADARAARTAFGTSARPAAPVTSDFNGDGFPDLVIGVPHDDTDEANDAGAVNVMYGSDVGIQVIAPPDQRWSQASLDVKGTAGGGDLFGTAVAAGDFNGDGFGDLAVGAPGDSVNGQVEAGVVNVLYGSDQGLEAETPIDDQLWTQDATDVLDQAENHDAFGSSLSAGDFNGDGFGDLAIGSPGENIGGTSKAGAVSVLYGTAAGLQASVAPDDQFWNQSSPDVRGKVETGDQLGYALTSGDFNADGFDDLGMGVYGQDVSDLDKAGSVAVLYGSSSRLQATSPDDQVWNRDTTDVEGTPDSSDHLGAALASGDFNGDGFDDLAAGAFGDDVGSPEILNAGSVNVLYGGSGGLQATSPNDQLWNQNSSDVRGKSEQDDHFGATVAAGDFNADGFDDLATGVPLEDLDSITDTGCVNVLYGTAARLQASAPDDQQWDQDSAGVVGSNDTGDEFGGVTASDFNGDTFDDLVIGIPGEPAGGVNGAGAISGLYGSLGGVQADDPDDVRKSQGSVGVEGDPGAGDAFGAAVLGS
jgi:FG-GAP repeat protein